MAAPESTERFTGRADLYDRYRPGYPAGILVPLREAYGLAPAHPVADIGSGTGKLTEVFLANGNPVFAVEPNADMRRRAEALLSGRPGFHSVAGRAEATTLAAGSVDAVVAGQAFHWFDAGLCAVEFRRILRPGGFVALIWNVRDTAASAMLEAYEAFVQEYSVTHEPAGHRRYTETDDLRRFFTREYRVGSFSQARELDFEAVWGGYLSASYSCGPGHPRHAEARARLKEIFDAHQRGGRVSMPLCTRVYHGRI